jgi:hypothetical protein
MKAFATFTSYSFAHSALITMKRKEDISEMQSLKNEKGYNPKSTLFQT